MSEPIAHVDYDVACCAICGRTEMHSDCDDQYGWFGERPYPHHDVDDE